MRISLLSPSGTHFLWGIYPCEPKNEAFLSRNKQCLSSNLGIWGSLQVRGSLAVCGDSQGYDSSSLHKPKNT